MKHSRTYLFAGALLSCLLAAAAYPAARAQHADRSHRKIPVTTAGSPKIPVTLSSASAYAVGRQTALSYFVSNQTGGRLTSLHTAAFILDASGQIRGGGGWESRVDIAPNGTEELAAVFAGQADAGSRLVLAPWIVEGGEGDFAAAPGELVNALTSRSAGARGGAPGTRYVEAGWQQQETSYSQSAQNIAASACRCGIQSFSSDDVKKTFSYSCFPKTNCVQSP